MRLMTLNTHSRPASARHVAALLAQRMIQEQLDVVALQEVNQSRDADVVDQTWLANTGYCAPRGARLPVGSDNFALLVAEQLHGQGYHWCYLPVKLGYQVYDEGLALLWRGEVQDFRALQLSRTRAYESWRRRMALGIRLQQGWFYSVHFSRWEEEQDSFLAQWERMHAATRDTEPTFLMGDFNCPADECDQGYHRMLCDGWHDLFAKAAVRVGEATAVGEIDGWRDRGGASSRRIDYIMSNDGSLRVSHAETIFDGTRGQVVISDHFGVLCEVERTMGGRADG